MKISSSFIPCFTSEKWWLVIFGYFKSALLCCYLNNRRDNDVCCTWRVLPTAAVWQALWVVNKTQAILMFPRDFWQWIGSVHLARNFISYPKMFDLIQNRQCCWPNKNRLISHNTFAAYLSGGKFQFTCHVIATRYVHVSDMYWLNESLNLKYELRKSVEATDQSSFFKSTGSLWWNYVYSNYGNEQLLEKENTCRK